MREWQGRRANLLCAEAGRRVTQMHYVRRGQATPEMEFVAIRQGCHIALSLEWLADPHGVFARSCQGCEVGRGHTRADRRDGEVFCWVSPGQLPSYSDQPCRCGAGG